MAVETLNSSRSSDQKRTFTSAIGGVVLAFLLLLVVRLLLQPDPQGYLLWTRAQRLENSNLIRPALRQYNLLAQMNNSPYAPLALERSGDILTDLARAGDTSRFREALTAYNRLAMQYPQSPQASNALLAIGDISLNDLKDSKAAASAYNRVLADAANRNYSSLAPKAMIGLGRVAMASRDGKSAQKWFQRVLNKFLKEREYAGEAQFRLGETYETLWHNKEFARNAYGATLANYNGTVWAARARESLGLLMYSDMVPRARRVLVKAANLTATGAPGAEPDNADSLLGALRLVLNARGLKATDEIVRGWSLSPFVAAFDPNNPARVVPLTLDGFENAVDAAGLTYSIDDGGDSRSARQNLQNEIDTGHLVLVFTGKWQLVIGYDSSRDEVFLSSGARAQTVSVKEFVAAWNQKSPLGGAYTSISFSTPGDDTREERLNAPQTVTRLLVAPLTSADDSNTELNLPNPDLVKRKPMIKGTGVAFSPAGLSAPTWVLTPPKADEKSVHRNAIRRAAEWMRRERSGSALLNLGALRTLEGELRRMAQAPVVQDAVRRNDSSRSDVTPTPAPAVSPTEEPARQVPESSPAPQDGIIPDSSTPENNLGLVLPDATPSDATPSPQRAQSKPTSPVASSTRAAITKTTRIAVTSSLSANTAQRLRAVLGWRGAPAAAWLNARRDAATYLNIAALRLNDPTLREAAKAFENSVVAIDEARALLDNEAVLIASGGEKRASPASLRFLERAAAAIERARREEARATEIMAAVR